MYLECNTEFEVLATKFNSLCFLSELYVSYLSCTCIPSGKGYLDPTAKFKSYSVCKYSGSKKRHERNTYRKTRDITQSIDQVKFSYFLL